MPDISFIVTCYNFASYIGECLDSILKQKTTQEFEIIVVDDASTDESDQIIRTFQDAPIRYIRHETNHGAVATMLEGFAAARGEYIARIDGDDRYRADYLERVLPIVECNPKVGLVYGDVAQINAQGNIVQDPWTGIRSQSSHAGRDFIGDEYLALLMEDVVPVPTMFIRRAALEGALPPPAELWFLDWYLILRITRNHQSYYMARTLADYRVHPQSRSHSLQSNHAYTLTVLRIMDQIFSEPDRQQAKRQIRRRAYSRAFLKFANTSFGTGQMKQARDYYSRALWYAPGDCANPEFVRHFLGTLLGAERYVQVKTWLRGNQSRV